MAGTGLPVVVVALRNPYDLVYLAENIHSFAAFEYSPLAFEAIRCILKGERSATGVLPIHWLNPTHFTKPYICGSVSANSNNGECQR